jgi:UrcA family protein
MRKSPFSLGVLGTLAMLAAGATVLPAAADGRLVEESFEVRYADLDLDKAAGVANLYARLRSAAEQVCSTGSGPQALFLSSSERACVTAALEQAVANVDRPALTAYHAARATSQAGVRGPRLAAARN